MLEEFAEDVRSWKVIKDQSSNLDVASLPRSFEAGLHSQIVLARSKVISKYVHASGLEIMNGLVLKPSLIA